MKNKKPKIILAGGGTLGSVSPLLAVADRYQADYIFIGSKTGPERKLIEKKEMPFIKISLVNCVVIFLGKILLISSK